VTMAGSSVLHAEDSYPSRPIRLIVPFTPGTGIDILARTLGQKIGDDWKASVVIDNRSGASGNIGTELVAKATPDGYTLPMSAMSIPISGMRFTRRQKHPATSSTSSTPK
jgi:tripartite-type tricarboxylate transporter receptor subunit TctC